MDDVYSNIGDYTPSRKRKMLIVFDDMIADIMSNKKFQSIIKELFIRCKKLNFSLGFITILFFCSKTSQIKFYTLLNNEDSQQRELQNITNNHSVDTDYKDFMKIYRKCTSEPYSFLTFVTTLSADNPLKFRKHLLIPYKNDIN